jgi:hypothetical protein
MASRRMPQQKGSTAGADFFAAWRRSMLSASTVVYPWQGRPNLFDRKSAE